MHRSVIAITTTFGNCRKIPITDLESCRKVEKIYNSMRLSNVLFMN